MVAFLNKIVRIDPNDKVFDPYRVTPDGEDAGLSSTGKKPTNWGFPANCYRIRSKPCPTAISHPDCWKSVKDFFKMEIDGKEL
jgi:hypothetical protein